MGTSDKVDTKVIKVSDENMAVKLNKNEYDFSLKDSFMAKTALLIYCLQKVASWKKLGFKNSK